MPSAAWASASGAPLHAACLGRSAGCLPSCTWQASLNCGCALLQAGQLPRCLPLALIAFAGASQAAVLGDVCGCIALQTDQPPWCLPLTCRVPPKLHAPHHHLRVHHRVAVFDILPGECCCWLPVIHSAPCCNQSACSAWESAESVPLEGGPLRRRHRWEGCKHWCIASTARLPTRLTTCQVPCCAPGAPLGRLSRSCCSVRPTWCTRHALCSRLCTRHAPPPCYIHHIPCFSKPPPCNLSPSPQ